MLMNPAKRRSDHLPSCPWTRSLLTASRLRSANPETRVLLIEFRTRPDSERIEVDQILAEEPLIGRLRVSCSGRWKQGPKPIVALVFESLGGLQLEIALACHARFANSQTIKLGFPWLKYGSDADPRRHPTAASALWHRIGGTNVVTGRERGCGGDRCLGIDRVEASSFGRGGSRVDKGTPRAKTALGSGSSGAVADLFSKLVESPDPREDLSQASATRHSRGSGSDGHPSDVSRMDLNARLTPAFALKRNSGRWFAIHDRR